MEMMVQPQEQIQYAEAYISDMPELKKIFLQMKEVKKVDPNFGLPFMLAKKKNETVAFASLIVNEKDEISFIIYDKNRITESEKRNFFSRAERYFKNNSTPNFRDSEQLNSSIRRMVSWLNLE
ncbi:hypothetical protein KYG33_14380 [Chryseobacterium sp. D764]|jgi:hypothetical protein|uniref:hypothetical protein n=1 Tax=unclassified Chryseobacterium TaxID=2593645 RepID=UPI0015C23E7E|nr:MULTISPECIES: hypothetical protein [unclassified Chryseobacterium]QXU47979.1 hypothetical protein KYG33_14380 [Chryseobacterium sp. D764]CAD0222441.1 conserved protein of unknown function [Chryseobacterium sp. JV274]